MIRIELPGYRLQAIRYQDNDCAIVTLRPEPAVGADLELRVNESGLLARLKLGQLFTLKLDQTPGPPQLKLVGNNAA